MTIAFSQWKPLVAAEIALLPESPGVFEIATLVRNVLFIGAASESLARTLATHLNGPGMLHARAGSLYFRHAPADDADRVQVELLSRYCERHGGSLPPAQSTPPSSPPRPQRHLKAV
jgi:hypothetical protein